MTAVVAVTGTTGFLGKEICRSLEGLGLKIHHINRNIEKSRELFGDGASHIDASLSSLQLSKVFSRLGIDVVVHAATHFSKFRDMGLISEVTGANLDFAIRNFEAAKEVGARYINLNSFWQQARPEDGMGPYAASKEAFRQYIELAAPASMLLENMYVPETFGPNDPRDKIVANLIRSRRSGTKYEINNPDIKIDLAFAPFIADFLSRSIKSDFPLGEKSSYINFPEVSLLTLQKLVEEIGQPDLSNRDFTGPSFRDIKNTSLPTKQNMLVYGLLPMEQLANCIRDSLSQDSTSEQPR
jgi:nucleoside-diphosphate-sugar epimerase